MSTNFYAMRKTAIVANCSDGSRRFSKDNGELSEPITRENQFSFGAEYFRTWNEAELFVSVAHRGNHPGIDFVEPVLVLTPEDKLVRLADELEREILALQSYGSPLRDQSEGLQSVQFKYKHASYRIDVQMSANTSERTNMNACKPSYVVRRGRKVSDRYEMASRLRDAMDDVS